MRDYTENELCETGFYLARYAECLEIDKTITVSDERELFWIIFEWAQEFERSFDLSGKKDYMIELETKVPSGSGRHSSICLKRMLRGRLSM